MGPGVWKAGETCIYRGIYGTISILFQGAALVEFDGYDRVTIPLNELTRSPHVAAHRPTGRWDSGNRITPLLLGSPETGLCVALRTNRPTPKGEMQGVTP